jgi:hypothetical protein
MTSEKLGWVGSFRYAREPSPTWPQRLKRFGAVAVATIALGLVGGAALGVAEPQETYEALVDVVDPPEPPQGSHCRQLPPVVVPGREDWSPCGTRITVAELEILADLSSRDDYVGVVVTTDSVG